MNYFHFGNSSKPRNSGPGGPEARSFLQEYRRMNTDFRNARNRRYALPFFALILIGIGMLWRGRERIFSLFRAPVQPVRNQTEWNAFGTLSESRKPKDIARISGVRP